MRKPHYMVIRTLTGEVYRVKSQDRQALEWLKRRIRPSEAEVVITQDLRETVLPAGRRKKGEQDEWRSDRNHQGQAVAR